MSADSPRLTVLMSVYNGERYLAEAVESIRQQSWKDFEFLIIDDGSTDGSGELLRRASERDARIRLITHDNCGLTRSLHEGVLAARAELIARMDADDIALPDRFAKQVAAFEIDPCLVVCGSGHECIDETGSEWYPYTNPVDDIALRFELLRHCPFVHSAVMFRRASALAVGNYDVSLRVGQDHGLWLKMSALGRIWNHPDVLVKQRFHAEQITANYRGEQLRNYLGAVTEEMLQQGYAMNGDEARAFFEFAHTTTVGGTKPQRLAFGDVTGRFLSKAEQTHAADEIGRLRERIRRECIEKARRLGWFSESGRQMLEIARRVDPAAMSFPRMAYRAVRLAWRKIGGTSSNNGEPSSQNAASPHSN